MGRCLVQGDNENEDDLASVYDHLDAWQFKILQPRKASLNLKPENNTPSDKEA